MTDRRSASHVAPAVDGSRSSRMVSTAMFHQLVRASFRAKSLAPGHTRALLPERTTGIGVQRLAICRQITHSPPTSS
jgi:hypothetical protein